MDYNNTTEQQPTHSLYLDDVSTSFWDLEDNEDVGVPTRQVEEGVARQKRSQEDIVTDGYGDYDDAEELFEDGEIEELGLDEDDEYGDDEDEDGKFADTDDVFNALPDDYVIKFGEEELSKSEVSTLLKNSKEVKESYTALTNLSTNLEQREVDLRLFQEANNLECDSKIKEIQRRMNDPMTTQSERGELYNHLQFYAHRKLNIGNQIKAKEADIYNSKGRVIQERLSLLNKEMSMEIPDWGTQAKNIESYALKAGISKLDLQQVASPALVRLLMKAMKHDNSIQSSKTVLKDKVASTKQRATVSSRNKAVESQNKRSKIMKAIEKGQAHPDDWFDQLED